MNEQQIIEPIYVIGEGEICKYRLQDAENDLEAYDIDCYEAFDAHYRPLVLYKKDRYNRVGFKLQNSDPQYKQFVAKVQQYMQTYAINKDIDAFIETIPTYPFC